MYGKVFEQMFTGSMVGAGPDVFAVWTYAIVHARPPGEVELNPRLLSVMLGMTIEDVEKVIAKLCSPDPYSRTPDNDGTRMVRRGQFLYFLPNWKKYRDIRNDEERREKEREYRRRYRAMGKEGCPDLSGTCPDLSEHDSDSSGLSGNVRNDHASESASACAVAWEEREHEREEAKPKRSRKPKVDAVERPAEVLQEHWDGWLKARAHRGAMPPTELALKAMRREAAAADITLDDAVRLAAENGWQAFRASYATSNKRPGAKQSIFDIKTEVTPEMSEETREIMADIARRKKLSPEELEAEEAAWVAKMEEEERLERERGQA